METPYHIKLYSLGRWRKIKILEIFKSGKKSKKKWNRGKMLVRYVVESYKEVLKDNLKYLDLPPDVLIIAKNKVFEAHSELLKIGSGFFRQIFTRNLTIDGVEYYSNDLWSSFKLIHLKNF